MTCSQRKCIVLVGVLVAAISFRSAVFVPPPSPVKSTQAAKLSSAACAAALLGLADTARADEIGDAAVKLSQATYPFMKEVPWYSNLYSINPGKDDAISWAKAIGKMIDMGASMDMDLIKAGAAAHHAGIMGSDSNGVCTQGQLTSIYASLGRMIASAPESKTMDVYNSVGALVDPKVPAYLMSTVNEKDADAAYKALVDFANVVKAHPIKPSDSGSTLSKVAQTVINAGANQLSAASYPFIKDIDWTSSLYSKPLPGIDAKTAMKAVDKMIVMGSEMDGASLKEAALAHVKAINGVNEKGVLSQGDYESINAGLGKAIVSVPTSKVMDVYYAMSLLVGNSPVPSFLYARVNPQNAQAAYNALLDFKDVVKAAKIL